MTAMKLTRLIPMVAAVSLLAACSPTPGTAVSFDGATLSEARVGQIIDGCVEATDAKAESFPRRAVVQTFMVGRLFDRVARDAGLDDSMIEEVATQNYSIMMDDEACKSLAIDSVKASFLEQVDRAQVITEAQEADVELNPRYGAWEPNDVQLFVNSGSISVPAQG